MVQLVTKGKNWTKTNLDFHYQELVEVMQCTSQAHLTNNMTNLNQYKTYQIWQQIYSSLNTCLQQTPPEFPDGKWIEILNNGSNVIDVSGWSITNGKGDLLYFDLGTMVFNQSHTGITEINSGERRLLSMSNNFDLHNYYEHLVLKDNSGVIIDSAWHGNYFGDNVSMIRDYDELGDAWILSN